MNDSRLSKWRVYTDEDDFNFLIRFEGAKPLVYSRDDLPWSTAFTSDAQKLADELNRLDEGFSINRQQAVIAKDVAAILNGWLNAATTMIARCEQTMLSTTAGDLIALKSDIRRLHDFAERVAKTCQQQADQTTETAITARGYTPQFVSWTEQEN